MSRTIVQIASATAAFDPETDVAAEAPRLYALCSDGTIWELAGRKWEQVPPIPEPEP